VSDYISYYFINHTNPDGFFEPSISFQEPLYLDKCIVCCETDLEDYFEIQELSSKETFIFKVFSLILNIDRDNMNLKIEFIDIDTNKW